MAKLPYASRATDRPIVAPRGEGAFLHSFSATDTSEYEVGGLVNFGGADRYQVVSVGKDFVFLTPLYPPSVTRQSLLSRFASAIKRWLG